MWGKTEAGRAEVQAKAMVKGRLQRSLLLLIDGNKSEEMILTHLHGLKHEDFTLLETLGLIERTKEGGRRQAAADSGVGDLSMADTQPLSQPATLPADLEDELFLDYGKFTSVLTKLISSELGLRGFTLTLAVEKASTIEELRAVARRVVEQIRVRKGDDAANAAQQALYGG